MSAAVKAALAARRAANRSRSTSPTKQHNAAAGETLSQPTDAFISPFGSPKPRGRALNKSDSAETTEVEMLQKPISDIVRSSVDTGRVNLASRTPALTEVPAELLSLLSDEPPAWYQAIPDDERGPWYAREEVRLLQLGNNELSEVSARLAEFPMLSRLEVQNNRLVSLPSSFFRLTALTAVNLANNALTAVPTCLLAVDTLVSLNLSGNKIQSLWDDATVLKARGEREQWDKDQAAAENGVWSGLSGGKKADQDKAPKTSREVPFHGLKALDLSNNKLDNAALGIPDLARRKNAAASTATNALVKLPRSLKKLDLGRNQIRGPVAVSLFAALDALEDLSLRGSGIGDDVFRVQTGEAQAGQTAFAALTTLDLGGCELDDLARLEEVFGSRRTKSMENALRADDQPAQPADEEVTVAAEGIVAHQLVTVPVRQPQSEIEKMVNVHGKVLCLVLDGNLLREEALKQKRGNRGSPVKRATPATPIRDASALLAQDPAIAAVSRTSTPAMPSTPSRKEEDAVGFAGASEQEAAGSGGENILHQFLRGRPTAQQAPDGISKTELGDWDGEAGSGRPSRGSKDRGTSQQRSNSDEAADKDPGSSALATAKLSTKKKEALGQVPCKFFRSNGCSAGSSCPFAHTLPGDGQQKATCQWFLKGSCRFGHKCALAHVLPGQPMSMDRKNKRAAQHGQPLPQVPGQTGHLQVGGPQQGSSKTPQNGIPQHQMPSQLHASRQQPQEALAQQQRQFGLHTGPSGLRQPSRTPADSDLVFGLPDDLPDDMQGLSQASGAPPRSSMPPPPSVSNRILLDTLNGADHASDKSTNINAAARQHAALRGDLTSSGSSLIAAQRALFPDQAGGGVDERTLSSPPAARAFGTSPFSHPGGYGLFFSGSQDLEGGAGPFARGGRDTMFGARSMGRIDDSAARAKWSSSLGGAAPREEEDDDNEDAGAEDFLPSSLSDLLTPAELERRKRNAQMSTSFSGRTERVMPQSLPTGAGATLGSSFSETGLGWGRRAIGAERGQREPSKTSNISTGFLQRRQGEAEEAQDTRPFGERRYSSGLDGIALNEAPGFASSPGPAAMHAPGQSLPQGMAAGLSRLHLASRREQGAQGPGSPAQLSGSASGPGSQHGQPGSQRSLGAGLGNDYELGPTAPSSVLQHRSPLAMAMGSGSGRLSGAFGSPGTLGSGANFSPSSFGAPRRALGFEPASFESDSSKQAAQAQQHGSSVAIGTGSGRPHQHPGMQRLRPSSSSITPHSPLTLPEFTHEEVEEEAIFELE